MADATYEVAVDRETCDGVFACLVRDSRFVEDADGLAGIDPDEALAVDRSDERVAARFDDDRREEAEQAAAACPLDAIAVTEVTESAEEVGDA